MADRLLGLRHHAIVGGNHQHDNVRHLGARARMAVKRFVARRIQEGDLAPLIVT